MKCPRCDARNPRGSSFCTRCGAGLTGPVSARPPRRRGPTGRGCLGCLGIGVIILIALGVIGNLMGSPGQQTAAPAATTPTESAVVAAPVVAVARKAGPVPPDEPPMPLPPTATPAPTDSPIPSETPLSTDTPAPAAPPGYHIPSLGLVVKDAPGWAFSQQISPTSVYFQGPELDDPTGATLGNAACGLSAGPNTTADGAYSIFKQSQKDAGGLLVKWTNLTILKEDVLLYLLKDTQTAEYVVGFFAAPHQKGVDEIICSMPLSTSDSVALLQEIKDAAAAWKQFGAAVVSD